MKNFIKILFLALIATSFSSCVKGDFDEPPTQTTDPAISADQIIGLDEVMDLRVSGKYTKINLDKYVKAVVVADDKSGNFYKTLVVEDENSDYGVSILIDQTELHNTYPIGRRVFIYLKNLWISDYNGLPQIGYGPYTENGRERMASIPSTFVADILKPGVSGIKIEPVEVAINQLGELRLNTLITIKDIQFANEVDTYSDAVTKNTLNKTLTTCTNQSILLRSSGYSTFAGTAVPTGKGTITAIYSIFGTDKQLMIRDVYDVQMNDARCGSGTGDEPRISIKDLKALYKGVKTTAPKSYIQGVVISDLTFKNINSKNVVIQDGEEGILVRFTADHTLQLGQSVKVLATDVELSEFNGILQLNNAANAGATVLGPGTLPTPRTMTIKEYNDNVNLYESTLINIKDAELSGGATYNGASGNVTVKDASGQFIMRTDLNATFKGTALPTGKVNIVGIGSHFVNTSGTSTPQIAIRNTTDVTSGSGGTPTCSDGIQNGDETGIDCGGSCPACNTGNETRITTESVRAAYSGTKTTAPNGYIQGVVITDLNSGNITANNFVLQDGKSGIVIRLTAANKIALGKEVKIITTGVELSEFNKLLQLNNVPAANVIVVGDGTLPTPKEITIADLKSNFEALESTLVVIKNATLSGAATYSGTIKVDDPTGQIDLFTRSAATFAGSALPSGAKTITAIVSEFTSASSTSPGYQLNIRTLDDVK